MNLYNIAIHESKNSDKVVRILSANSKIEFLSELSKNVSASYAKKIIKAIDNNDIDSLYLSKSGKIRAAIVK
jgi:hypothetical protein